MRYGSPALWRCSWTRSCRLSDQVASDLAWNCFTAPCYWVLAAQYVPCWACWKFWTIVATESQPVHLHSSCCRDCVWFTSACCSLSVPCQCLGRLDTQQDLHWQYRSEWTLPSPCSTQLPVDWSQRQNNTASSLIRIACFLLLSASSMTSLNSSCWSPFHSWPAPSYWEGGPSSWSQTHRATSCSDSEPHRPGSCSRCWTPAGKICSLSG